MVAPNALTASAQLLKGERSEAPDQQQRPWQDEAWAFYDESGPLRYGTNWLANLISRARLMAAEVGAPGDEPITLDSGPAAEAVEAMAGGTSGQSKLLRSSVVGLTVPGICYLVGQGKNEQTWQICSADELRMRSPAAPGRLAVYEQMTGKDNTSWVKLPDDSMICKIWRPHERFHWEADSPARAALSSLRELRRIAQYIDATLVSRLAGAGILLLPTEGISYPAHKPTDDSPAPTFITEVVDVMMDAVKRPGTASALVPIPITIPSEFLDKVKHLDFSTELSEKVLDMRESALRQAAIAIDVPAEVLTGMGEVNHWGQWQIEESAVKIHAEPLLELITHALTIGFLHPVLLAGGMDKEEVLNHVMWADTSEMTARPDKSSDAIRLSEEGVLKDEALLRETGFSGDDAPSDEEFAVWAYRQLLKQPVNAAAALEGLGIKVPESMKAQPIPEALGGPPEASETENSEVPEDEESGAEDRTLPDTQDDEPFNLGTVIALEGFVYRALELAGNRAKNKLSKAGISLNGGTAEDPERFLTLVFEHLAGMDIQGELLFGVWKRLDSASRDLGLDPVATCVCLTTYTETIIRQGYSHNRDSFVKALRTDLAVAA